MSHVFHSVFLTQKVLLYNPNTILFKTKSEKQQTVAERELTLGDLAKFA